MVHRRTARASIWIAGVGGALLFYWSLRFAGTAAVLQGVRRVGVWFLAIWALGGIRYGVRAVAWRLCLDDPSLLPLKTAFGAALMGDSLGNVTPFGALMSEPSKVMFVRGRLTAGAAIASVTVENLFYAATVVIVLICGAIALLLSYHVDDAVRRAASLALGGAVACGLIAIAALIWRVRVVSSCLVLLERWRAPRGLAGRLRPDIVGIEDQIFGFATRHPTRVLPLVLLEIAYHAAATLETWITLTLVLGRPVGFLTAFVFEFVNRTITIAFQFVPMWIGVDEAGTGLVSASLGLGGAAGVGLALVRKARVVVWTGLGLTLFFVVRSWPNARWTSSDAPSSGSRPSTV